MVVIDWDMSSHTPFNGTIAEKHHMHSLVFNFCHITCMYFVSDGNEYFGYLVCWLCFEYYCEVLGLLG